MDCPFPSALAALERLTMLDLAMNDLTGTLDADVVPGGRLYSHQWCAGDL
jgi:hypothetical protein